MTLISGYYSFQIKSVTLAIPFTFIGLFEISRRSGKAMTPASGGHHGADHGQEAKWRPETAWEGIPVLYAGIGRKPAGGRLSESPWQAIGMVFPSVLE